MIKVLLAEDQSMLCGALAALLELEDDLTIVASASDGQQALELLDQHSVDVVVTDIEMPRMTGLELAQAIQQRMDGQRSVPKVIILTTFARAGYLRRAMDAGVRGYLLKDSPADQLSAAIRTIHQGGKIIAPELATAAWGAQDPLTDRERQILRLAAEGQSTIDIAQQVHLAEGTVRNYLSEAINKLGASNRVEAARLARQEGWL